jgi:hypothetical protein
MWEKIDRTGVLERQYLAWGRNFKVGFYSNLSLNKGEAIMSIFQSPSQNGLSSLQLWNFMGCTEGWEQWKTFFFFLVTSKAQASPLEKIPSLLPASPKSLYVSPVVSKLYSNCKHHNFKKLYLNTILASILI